MAQRICAVEVCNRTPRWGELCEAHYSRKRRLGSAGTTPVNVRTECSVDDCVQLNFARGLCKKHYTRLTRTGTTSRPTSEDLFWNKVDKTNECWIWTGHCDTGGYGRFGKRHELTHRYSYRLAYGHLPESPMEIDHQCGNRKCVRPDHLRPVTRKQNQENLRGARRTSKSGVRGVHRHGRRWIASVGHNNEKVYLGSHETLKGAAEVARSKRNELFTHNDVDRSA